MAASFLAASSQRLLNSTPPVTNYPFTVGMWVYPTTTGAVRSFWSLGDTAGTANFWRLSQTATNVWQFTAQPNSADAGTVTANRWAFLVARGINATNRRVSALQYNGVVAHGQNTTNTTPAGIDVMAIGATIVSVQTHFFSGLIGEFWYTNTDIQADGAQLQDATLRQLAYGGPSSLPHIAKDIIEYRSFWSALSSDQDKPEEVYWGAAGRQTWVNVNGVTRGPHCPLPMNYRRPGDAVLVGLV